MSNAFKRGMQSVITIFPHDSNIKVELPDSTDLEALEKDWKQVGNDLWKSINKIDEEKQKRAC